LLAHGWLRDLKRAHHQLFEIRVKKDQEHFAKQLALLGCSAEPKEDCLLVTLPPEQTPELFWKTVVASGDQIRFLRPRRSTLEEVFLKAVTEQS
jgi:ABC-2 type transport system ATP-binding protein